MLRGEWSSFRALRFNLCKSYTWFSQRCSQRYCTNFQNVLWRSWRVVHLAVWPELAVPRAVRGRVRSAQAELSCYPPYWRWAYCLCCGTKHSSMVPWSVVAKRVYYNEDAFPLGGIKSLIRHSHLIPLSRSDGKDSMLKD